MPILPLDDWTIERVRLTVFPVEPTELVEGWWAAVSGEAPEKTSTNRRTGELREEGPLGDATLSLVAKHDRVDWVIRSSATPADDSPFVTVGSYTARIEDLTQIATTWLALESVPPLKRLAVGSVLLHEEENSAAGYEQLQSYLPRLDLNPGHSRDLHYRINRPRPSRVLAGLERC